METNVINNEVFTKFQLKIRVREKEGEKQQAQIFTRQKNLNSDENMLF